VVSLTPAGDAWAGEENGVEFKVRPLDGVVAGDALVENTLYQLLVKLATPLANPTLRLEGLPLECWSEGKLLGGQIDVGHTFGQLRIEVRHDGQTLAEATGEVRPRHLRPDVDYPQIKADLDRVSFSLVYAIWRRAHQEAFPDFRVPQGTPEFLAMLRNTWSRIKRALREIDRNPNTELLLIHEVRRAERVGLLDSKGLRWLAQQPSAWTSSNTPLPVACLQVGGRYIAPERALATRREITLNTPANRALKYALSRLEARLRTVLQVVNTLPAKHFAAADKDAYADQLRQILRDSQHYTVHGFLAEVEARPSSSQRLHVVRADPRYRQVFRSLRVLQWGVLSDVAGPVTEMSLKDTWELYEYWVYLFVLGLFTSWGWDCVTQGAFTVSQSGAPILLDLARGKQSQSEFERTDEATGKYRHATVTFHREFPSRRANPGLGRGALTVTRNVDVLIEVESGGKMRRVVLDPKYQAELKDGRLTCPQGAVDSMHVYRDSIGRWEVGPAGGRHFVRSLDAAVAVFPSRDEAGAASSIFFESLTDGVGALPLLPPDANGPHLLPTFLNQFVS
jgi:hypothetical protein